MEALERFLNLPAFKRVVAFGMWGHPLLLIALAILIILPGLGEGSLRNWDEAIYAQVSKEIIQRGDWITLYHGNEPYYEKPPLLMWSTAIFYKLFGVSEFSARMPSALSAILLVYVTYLTGKTIYGNGTGFLAGLILIGSYKFAFQARNGETDMLLSLFVCTGIFAYLRLRDGSQKWWYLILGACGLAFMVKVWAGLVLPAILVIILLLERKITTIIHSKHFWLGLLLAGIIVTPWYLLVYLQNGSEFIDSLITRNLLTRTLTSLEGHSGSPFFYLDVLRRYFSPWFFLLPFALALSIKELLDSREKASLLIIQILLIFGLYTFGVNTKNSSYIFPIYPALSILVAHVFVVDSSTPQSGAVIWIITAALFATTIAQDKLLVLCIFAGVLVAMLTKTGILSKKSLSQIVTNFVFVGFFLISVISFVLGNHRLNVRPIYGMQVSSVAQIATLAGGEKLSATDPLIGFALEEDWDSDFAVEGPTALFYSNRPIDVVFTWEQLEQLMSDQGTGGILIAEKYLPRLSQDFDITVIEKVDPLVYANFNR